MAVAVGSKVSKQVIKSPNMALSYLVSVTSLLAGAAVVHNIFKPDLTIPDLSSQDIMDKESEDISNVVAVD